MEKLLKNKWFWLGVVIAILLFIVFWGKKEKKGKLTADEQRVWDKVKNSNYELTPEEEKQVKAKGEVALFPILKSKLKLSDGEVQLFVSAWNKLALERQLYNIANK